MVTHPDYGVDCHYVFCNVGKNSLLSLCTICYHYLLLLCTIIVLIYLFLLLGLGHFHLFFQEGPYKFLSGDAIGKGVLLCGAGSDPLRGGVLGWGRIEVAMDSSRDMEGVTLVLNVGGKNEARDEMKTNLKQRYQQYMHKVRTLHICIYILMHFCPFLWP